MKLLLKVKEGYIRVNGTPVKTNKYPDIKLAIHRGIIKVDSKWMFDKSEWVISCCVTGLSTVKGKTKSECIDNLNYRLDEKETDGEFIKLLNDAIKRYGKVDKNNIINDFTIGD